MTEVSFWVPGIPAPGGSKRGFVHKSTGRVIITEDCKRSKDWRAVVAVCATGHIKEPLNGPIEVMVTFYLPRPKGHYGSGKHAGVPRHSAPPYPITRPDLTKMWRSTEDAMKGIVWTDDSQVVAQFVRKLYAETQPGAQINVREYA